MSATTTSPAATTWHGALKDLAREHAFVPLEVEGALPAGLAGTLWRIGMGRFSRHGVPYRHWFDGEGVAVAVQLADGQARGAAKILRSPHALEEERAGRPLYSGFGSPAPGFRGWWNRFRRRPKNAANTNLLALGERLFALYEAGKPLELSTDDLSALGEWDLGGQLVGPAFSAHPHPVPGRRATYGFGQQMGPNTQLHLYELPWSGATPRRLGAVSIVSPTLLHDFIATERHLVFFVSPLVLKILPSLLGIGTLKDNLYWRPEKGTEVIVVPIDEPSRARRFVTEPFFQFHFVNAFDSGPDEVTVDFVRYADWAAADALVDGVFLGRPAAPVRARLERARLGLGSGLGSGSMRFETLWDRACEFPTIRPSEQGRAPSSVWLQAQPPADRLGSNWLPRLARFDIEKGEADELELEDGLAPSEPLFVPDPRDARGGWVLSLVADPARGRSWLGVWDALAIGQGPRARVWFDQVIPATFHGVWTGPPGLTRVRAGETEGGRA